MTAAGPARPPRQARRQARRRCCYITTRDRTATLNIRQLDPALKEQLRVRAAHNGRSMEAEARSILKEALTTRQPATGEALAAAIRRRFAPLGGVELELPSREPGREPPRFE